MKATVLMRYCRECAKLKPDAAFYGKSKLCKECAKDYQHEYYHKLVKASEGKHAL